MRRTEILKTESNARVYRMLERSIISGCPICGPNSGCNRRGKPYDKRNWKSYRKTKYKI